MKLALPGEIHPMRATGKGERLPGCISIGFCNTLPVEWTSLAFHQWDDPLGGVDASK